MVGAPASPPRRHDFLVRQVAGVLQELQAHHQLQRVVWAADAGGIQPAEAALAGLPVDVLGQLHQRMTQLDEIDQFLTEQVRFRRMSGLAKCREFARLEALISSNLAIFMPTH